MIKTVKDLKEALKSAKCKPSDKIDIRDVKNSRGDSTHMPIYKIEWNKGWKEWQFVTGSGMDDFTNKPITTVKELKEALKSAKCKPSDNIGIKDVINSRGDSYHKSIYEVKWHESWKNWGLMTGEGYMS